MITSTPAKGSPELLDAVLDEAPIPSSKELGETDDYRIRIPSFEGPLDLLLHLIRKEQVNIYDIPVAQICRSYLEYLSLMRKYDVNVAGEFMVMAATLTHLKSIVLLPSEKPEDEEEDPRMPLVQQLLEYERYKEAAQKIDARPWLFREQYPRPEGAATNLIPKEALNDGPIEPIDNFQLLLCLKIALDRTTRPPIKITGEPVSMRETVTEVSQQLIGKDATEFKSLFESPEQRRQAREIIRKFLALLELAKLRFIQIIQTETYGPIQIRPVRPMTELDLSLLEQP